VLCLYALRPRATQAMDAQKCLIQASVLPKRHVMFQCWTRELPVTADDLTSSYLGGPGCHCDGTLLCKQHRNLKKKLFRIRDMLVQTGPRIYGSGSCYFRQ
jgi:hypothetical protein